MYFYFAGMALLGISTGFLVASSLTPILTIVLPLFFGLVGGGAAAYLLKLNPDDAIDGRRLSMLGKAITSFFGAFILSLLLFISLRFESTAFPVAEVDNFVALDATQAYKVLTMRKRLQILGASPKEQQALLDKFTHDSGAVAKPNAKKDDDIASEKARSEEQVRVLNEMLPLISDARKAFYLDDVTAAMSEKDQATALGDLRVALAYAEVSFAQRLHDPKADAAEILARTASAVPVLDQQIDGILLPPDPSRSAGLFAKFVPSIEVLVKLKQKIEDFQALRAPAVGSLSLKEVERGFGFDASKDPDEELVKLLIAGQLKQPPPGDLLAIHTDSFSQPM